MSRFIKIDTYLSNRCWLYDRYFDKEKDTENSIKYLYEEYPSAHIKSIKDNQRPDLGFRIYIKFKNNSDEAFFITKETNSA